MKTSKRKIYVVEGEAAVGDNSNKNRISWIVMAYDNRRDAVEHAQFAEKFSESNFQKKINNPWDSQMSKKSKSIYNVVECAYQFTD